MTDDRTDRRIDDALRAAFEPPADAEFAAMAGRAARPDGGSGKRLWPWFAAAAALLCVALVLFERGWREADPLDGAQLGALWVAAYEDARARGFAGGCCDAGFDLSAASEERFACRVGIADGGRVAVAGSYCGLETGGCMALIARHGEMPVCVYVVKKSRDPHIVVPERSDLYLARRELGDVVLYSLSSAPADAALTEFVTL